MLSLTRVIAAPALALSLALSAPAPLLAGTSDAKIETSIVAGSVKKSKQTKAGLYITAAEAAQVLAAREDVLLIDVRTPEETILVGYPTATDVNVPIALFDPQHKLNAKKGSYAMVPNPAFAGAVKSFLEGRDPAAVLVMCRSGGRSAKAVDALLKAGVEVPLYSVIDGFEGDKDANGKRAVNGWKNAGAAWTDKAGVGFLQGAQ